MKKTLVILLIVGLMTALVGSIAYAQVSDTDDQVITGDVGSSLVLTVEADVDFGAAMTIGDNTDNDGTDDFNVQGNVTYGIQFNSDSDATKTTAAMHSYDNDTTGYTATPGVLHTWLGVTEQGDSTFQDLSSTTAEDFTDILNIAPPADGQDDYDIDYKQNIDYTDEQCSTAAGFTADTYRCVITWTALEDLVP